MLKLRLKGKDQIIQSKHKKKSHCPIICSEVLASPFGSKLLSMSHYPKPLYLLRLPSRNSPCYQVPPEKHHLLVLNIL